MLIPYTVSYKTVGGLFWHVIRNVVADAIQENYPFRVLVLADETRIELPLGIPIRFSKERSSVIKANEAEAKRIADEQAEQKKQNPKLFIPGGKR